MKLQLISPPPARLEGSAQPSRRELLQLLGLGAAWLVTPRCARSSAPYAPKFLTAAEASALAALADGILPPDRDPGGASLGVVEYVDRLLCAFEGGGPLYAGGPYSGREPYPRRDGTPSGNYPPNAFITPLPLDRITEAAWRLMLYGSDAVGGGPNDALAGKVVGLREQVRQGLAAAIALRPKPLAQLTATERSALLNQLDPAVLALFVELTAEAAFAPPEYGGNPAGAGWKLASFEGDSQPLGYSWFNPDTNSYQESPAAPVSTANPGTDPNPLDDATRALVDSAIIFLGGRRFS